MTKNETKQIKIKLKRSLIGTTPNQRKVVAGLGLSKKDQVVEHNASATINGMIAKVSHLVEIVK